MHGSGLGIDNKVHGRTGNAAHRHDDRLNSRWCVGWYSEVDLRNARELHDAGEGDVGGKPADCHCYRQFRSRQPRERGSASRDTAGGSIDGEVSVASHVRDHGVATLRRGNHRAGARNKGWP